MNVSASKLILCLGVLLAFHQNIGLTEERAAKKSEPTEPKAAFRTLFVTRSLAHEQLMPYLKTAKPELVQIGNYGAMFHGYADNPKAKGSPMMLPVSGEREALAFQKKLNEEVHKLGLDVVGHFRVVKVMADWQEQSGFVEYYNKRWPTDLLGPKPHADLKELLQRDVNGNPVQVSRYANAQLTLCLSSPYARTMLKQMLKCAVDHGVDGVMTTYNYRFNCACPHCQTAFKGWLTENLTEAEIQEKLKIANLKKHTFPEIPARIPGYPDAATATELDWLAARWGAEHFKKMYDDIFIDYGRTLNKDLIVGQWNHLSHVSLKEERMFVPLELWGTGEDYFWYSGGASFVGKSLNLAERKAGDAWLSCLYVRAMSGGKPFVMGKYDGIRMAASMGEGFATGGLGMGRYMRFEDPVAFEVLARYTNFMHKHRDLYEGAIPYADAALLLPRQSILARHPDSLDAFRSLGQALLEKQVLLDVIVDQTLSAESLSKYPAIILPKAKVLTDAQLKLLSEYAADGGRVICYGETGSFSALDQPRTKTDLKGFIKIDETPISQVAQQISQKLRVDGGSEIEAAWTLRVAAYSQNAKSNRTLLHLVNYDRDETPVKGLKGPALERPKPTAEIPVKLRLPKEVRPLAITLHTPDGKKSTKLPFELQAGKVCFTIPPIHVYTVIEIEHQPR